MRVLVIGSYRPQEGQHRFARDAGARFKATAFALGKSLAEQGHDLVIGWSHNNLLSQLGVKTQNGTRVFRHPQCHPYWETADFHALRGFLSILRHYPQPDVRKRVFLVCVGRCDELPDAMPFAAPALLDRLADAPLRCFRAAPGETLSSALDSTDAIDLAEDRIAQFVDLRYGGEVNSSAMRQELLIHLAQDAEIVIAIGGGKATLAAMAKCCASKLLVPMPFSREGGFSEEEEQEGQSQSKKLKAKLGELAAQSHGASTELAHQTARRLATLLAAAKDSGPAIPYHKKAFLLSLLLIVPVAASLCIIVWASAQAKGASIYSVLAIQLFALTLFCALLWSQFEYLFQRAPNSRQIFFGVVSSGLIACAGMLGPMNDLLGLIEPRLAVSDRPIDAQAPRSRSTR